MNAKKIINIMNIQSYMFKIVLFASCLLSSPGLFAQCFDNSLNISTGAIENRDPTTFGAARRQDVAANGINDLHWRITNLSLALSTLYGTAIFNYPAMIVPCTLHTWGLNNEAAATAGCTINTTGKPNANWPESHWIAAIDATVQGFHWPQTTSAVNPYVTTYRRDFRICQDGDFDFNIVLAADNFCTAMRVDGIPVGNLLPQAGGHTPGNYTQFNDVNNPLVFKLALGAGLHNIEVDVENFHIAGSDNPHGLNLSGTIWETSNNPSLFNDFITDCEPCVVDEGPCSDLCYWTVTGNNINGINHNIFGTLNNNDIRIVTNNPSAIASQDRGIITKDGLFGWNLRTTNLPTAFLDVDCNGHNSQASGTSDIRFRSLETTNNTAFKSLVIDPATGYVYNSNVSPGGSSVAGWDLLGNSISGSNFLGTTNFDDLRIKAGNRQSVLVKSGSSAGDLQAGFVGINTTAPSARLHVNCNAGNEGGLSDVRLEGLEPNTTGKILVIDANGYVYNSNVDVNNTVTATGVQNNCGTKDMVVKDDGTGNLTCSQIYNDAAAGGVGINSTGPFFYSPGTIYGNGAPSGINNLTLLVNGATQSLEYVATSDARLKTNIMDIRNPLSLINSLQGKTYNWNEIAKNEMNADNGRHYGFIAQEVGKVMPEAVIVGEKGNYGLEYNAFIPLLTEGQKELYKLYTEEKAKNDKLETELTALKARVDQLANTGTQNIDKITPENGNELYQNNPNPFGHETSIGFNIVKMQESAFIAVYDLNGREIYKYAVTAKGKGSVTINGEKLVPGQYLYSLIVDGREEDTKKMVVMK